MKLHTTLSTDAPDKCITHYHNHNLFPVKMPLTFDQKMKTAHMVFGHKILHLLFLAQKMNKLYYIKQYQPRVFETNLPATMISTQSIHFCATVWADES